MADDPRFDCLTGTPDTAHETHQGRPLVSLVFRLVDAWRDRKKRRVPPGQTSGAIEIPRHPSALAQPAVLASAMEAIAWEHTVHQLPPGEHFSGSFLIGSARTMKLQACLLAAIATILIILVAQGLSLPDRPHSQSARNSAPPAQLVP